MIQVRTTPIKSLRIAGSYLRRLAPWACLLLGTAVFASQARAANYYVDPGSGSMGNNGSSGSPWSTLADVFSAGKTFNAGDVIYLRFGNHGHPQITASNAGDVTIKAQSGHSPVINRIHFNGADHWVVEDVTIYTSAAPPEAPVLVHPVYPKINNSLVRITNGSTNITLRNCDIYSINDSSSWTANDWNNKAWNGVFIHNNCEEITVEGCSVRNTNFALHTVGSATNVVFSNNLVENFCGDGVRAAADG